MATFNPQTKAIFDLLAKTNFEDNTSADVMERALYNARETKIPLGDQYVLLVDPSNEQVSPDYQQTYFRLGYIEESDGEFCPYALVVTRENPPSLALVFTRLRLGTDGFGFNPRQTPDQDDEYLIETPIEALSDFYSRSSSDAISRTSRYSDESLVTTRPMWFPITSKYGNPVGNLDVLRSKHKSYPAFPQSYRHLLPTLETGNKESVQNNTQGASKTSTAPTSQPLTRQNTIRFVTNIESELDSAEEPQKNIVETSTTRPSERLVENGNPNMLESTQSETRSPIVNEHTEQVASGNAKGAGCGCCVS